MVSKLMRYAGQAVFYALFILVVGYFSTSPAYVHLPPGQALIKLSFSHAGQPAQPCRPRTPEELAQLPPNMRAPLDCARERSPVRIDLELDGQPLYRAELAPAGLRRDGASTLYRRFPVAAGKHHIRVRLKDDVPGLTNAASAGRAGAAGALPDYNYAKQAEVTLASGQVFVVDSDARKGGFVFK